MSHMQNLKFVLLCHYPQLEFGVCGFPFKPLPNLM